MTSYKTGVITLAVKCLVIAIAVLSMEACLPPHIINSLYRTPAVHGTVIDLKTLKPIEGVLIHHYGSGEWLASDGGTELENDTIVTNKAGEYYLPSAALAQGVMRPGHVIRDYPVKIMSKKNSALVFVSASLKMTRANTLIMDSNPETPATTPPGNYESYQQLRTYIHPSDTLGRCNTAIAEFALAALNTARKVYWRHIKNPDVTQELVDVSYLHVSDVWRYFYGTCDFGEHDTIAYRDAVFAVQKITDRVKNEAKDLSVKL